MTGEKNVVIDFRVPCIPKEISVDIIFTEALRKIQVTEAPISIKAL